MNTAKRNKIKGAIYGFAVGDAMGATTEFMRAEQIKEIYGKVTNIIGGGWLNLKPGEVTDDTQMTMCVMDALMTDIKFFEDVCAENFCKWYESGPKDVGRQCAKGITYLLFDKRVSENNNALGNGSLMRAMPCALLNRLDLNRAQGKLTHNNKHCSYIISEYTSLLQNYLNGYNDNILIFKMRNLLEPSGYVVNTFNNSVYWSNKNSFEEAIIGAVNDGGDADTIAAITGSLAGAKFGFDKIPKEWVEALDPEVKIFLEKFKNFVFDYLQI